MHGRCLIKCLVCDKPSFHESIVFEWQSNVNHYNLIWIPCSMLYDFTWIPHCCYMSWLWYGTSMILNYASNYMSYEFSFPGIRCWEPWLEWNPLLMILWIVDSNFVNKSCRVCQFPSIESWVYSYLKNIAVCLEPCHVFMIISVKPCSVDFSHLTKLSSI